MIEKNILFSDQPYECTVSFYLTDSEQEWKLAQSKMEAASDGLFSASNELCIASVKAKSASGHMSSLKFTIVHIMFPC